VYDVDVAHASGELVATFRGRSAATKGRVLDEGGPDPA
jgi:hypothetical protein